MPVEDPPDPAIDPAIDSGIDSRVGDTGPPWTVRAAAALALGQAVGTATFAVLFLADVVPFEEPRLMRAGFALGVVVLVAGAAGVLVLAARALLRMCHWPRALLVVAQIMALAFGVPMARGDDSVGWLIVSTALAGLVLLLHPMTTAALAHPTQAPRPQ